MATRKLNHHLYQDETSGIWYFQKQVNGKCEKRSLKTRSKIEARRKRDEMLKEIDYLGYIPDREQPSVDNQGMLFGEVALQWAEIKKTKLAETTYYTYQKAMNTHVLPHFGNMPIESITSLGIEQFLGGLTTSPKNKINIYTPFKGVMRFAKKHKFIKYDPTVDVEAIKYKRSEKAEHIPFALDEINLFLENLEDFWKPLFNFLFYTGVRICEASALKWKRVDLSNNIVKIHRNLVYVQGRKIFKSTKTEGSYRDVSLIQPAIEALRQQRKQTYKGDPEGFVFLNKLGDNIHRHTLNRKVIRPTLIKAGLATNRSIKDTRASYIINCMDSGERISFVKRQVGHTTTHMLINHYYKWVPAADDGSKLEKVWKATSILPDQTAAEN